MKWCTFILISGKKKKKKVNFLLHPDVSDSQAITKDYPNVPLMTTIRLFKAENGRVGEETSRVE